MGARPLFLGERRTPTFHDLPLAVAGRILDHLRPTADPAGACLLHSPAGRASSQRQGSGSRPTVLLQTRDHTVAEVEGTLEPQDLHLPQKPSRLDSCAGFVGTGDIRRPCPYFGSQLWLESTGCFRPASFVSEPGWDYVDLSVAARTRPTCCRHLERRATSGDKVRTLCSMLQNRLTNVRVKYASIFLH